MFVPPRHIRALAISIPLLQSAVAIETGDSDGMSKPWTDSSSAGQAGGSGLVVDENKLLEGLSTGLAATVLYDSNVAQGDGLTRPVVGDWIFSVAPSFSWEREIRDFKVRVEANANYDQYLDQDDYSGLDYRGATYLNYTGGPLSLDGSLRYSHVQGVDRYLLALTERDTVGFNFKGSYKLSSKTSLKAEISTDRADSDSKSSAVNPVTTRSLAQVSAMWWPTPLVGVGPGVRATQASGESQGDRNTVGPVLAGEYHLTQKIDVDAAVGLDFVDYDGGNSDEFCNASLGLKYRLDALWSFRFDLDRDAQADSSLNGGFRETTGFRFGVIRKVLAANVKLGIGYETADFWGSNGVPTRPGSDYFNFDAAVGMPLFAGRGNGQVFFRYQENTSNDVTYTWDGIQSGVSLSYKF